jgi:hypothetical protein
MATSIRLRRGTNAERLTVIFADGEPVYTTDTHKLFIGDGVTLGGIEVGPLTLTWADVGADQAGTAAAAVSAHEGETDPHPQYTTDNEAFEQGIVAAMILGG